MRGVRVRDLAYVRLAAPDLDAMESFLTAFGLRRAAREDDRLYMMAADDKHHVHITERGAPRFIGFAFEAASREDLDVLAALPEASPVEARLEPGGGERVILKEPNGYAIEVVYGIDRRKPTPVQRLPVNTASEPLRRAGVLMRPEPGPSTVTRIAHCVLGTPKAAETIHWFRDTLGLIGSDDIYDKSGALLMGFSRLDRGEEYVDHHVLFCVPNAQVGLNHVSFEVLDVDDVFMGNEHMRKSGGYEHVWGVGRHLLGSNVFDYWADPWGRIHEHWSDSDRLNAASGSNRHALEDGVMRGIWGAPASEQFRKHVSP
jgi:catechol 2,3-dioxygenase-like lactoylglutathione lyase family enzyme